MALSAKNLSLGLSVETEVDLRRDLIFYSELCESLSVSVFGRAQGKKVYTYCVKNISPMFFEKTPHEERQKIEFSQTKILFHTLTSTVTINNTPIYYREIIEGKELLRPVCQKVFVNDSEILFYGQGEKLIEFGGICLNAVFCRSILDIINKKEYQETYFNHSFHTNSHKQEIDEIAAELRKNRDWILLEYEKDFTKMSEANLKDFCTKKLHKEISGGQATEILHIIKTT